MSRGYGVNVLVLISQLRYGRGAVIPLLMLRMSEWPRSTRANDRHLMLMIRVCHGSDDAHLAGLTSWLLTSQVVAVCRRGCHTVPVAGVAPSAEQVLRR